MTHKSQTAFLLPILQALCISTKEVRVYTYDDRAHYNDRRNELGPFVIPADLMDQSFNSTISNVISDTINSQLTDSQPNLWRSGNGAVNLTSLAAALEKANDRSGYQRLPLEYFTSALPIGSNTGVLRYLGLRMNTSIDCQLVPQTLFPATCSSDNGFYRDFSNMNDSDPDDFYSGTLPPGHPSYRGRICAPGEVLASPWKETPNRQDIQEDLWIDFTFSNLTLPKRYGGYYPLADRANFTQHCTSNSTLGFFEVPNYWNGNIVGPLLTEPPSVSHNKTYKNTFASNTDFYDQKVPGPLMASTLAIFGQDTVFDLLAEPKTNEVMQYSSLSQAFCSQVRYPFSGLVTKSTVNKDSYKLEPFSNWDVPTNNLDCQSKRDRGSSSDLLIALMTFMPQFADPINTIAALTLTTYSVHKHIFTTSIDSLTPNVYQWDGSKHQKPDMSTAAMIVITLLLLFQLCGLGSLAVYAYIRPSWTETLDAKAILKVGAGIAQTENARDHIPNGVRLATSNKEMASLLDQTEGWAGRALRSKDTGEVSDADAFRQVINGAREGKVRTHLVLGGKIPVTKDE